MTELDISNHICLPREDYYEMVASAYNNPTNGQRVAQVLQNTTVFAGVAGMFVAAAWGWAKAVDWLDKKETERLIARSKIENEQDNTKK